MWQSLKETGTIPDLQGPGQGSLQERAGSKKAQSMEVIASAPEGEEDESPKAHQVLESGSLPELQEVVAAGGPI